jgi:hypothetical protein
MARAPCTFRKADLKRAVEAVVAAGLRVVGVKVSAEGHIEVVTSNGAGQVSGKSDNDWDKALSHDPH